MKTIRNLLALFLLTLGTIAHAESISVSPVILEPGGIVSIPVNCEFSCEDITLYQFDLYLPEGVTLVKNAKGRYAAGTTYVLSDRHDEHTASLKDNGGFIRFVVSQNDGYLITPGEGLLLTLNVQADASVSGELQASIKNFMMFETNETKHAMSDVTFKMTVPGASVPATGISLNHSSATLISRGQTLQLTATVTPDDATDKSVTWTSSNPAVASVSNKGLVTAIADGNATIIAKTADGSYISAKCAITVSSQIAYSFDTSSRTASVTGLTSSVSSDIVIPANVIYDDVSYAVCYIGSRAFKNNTSLTSVSILGSIISIGNYAIENCTSLTSVNIPNGVKQIGYGAFAGCTSLTSMSIGNSLVTLEGYAFRNCISLTSLDIPNSMTYIGSGAFSGCYSLTSVNIPDGVTAIGDYTFYNCSGLTSVTIGNGVTSIGYSAFYNCRVLTSVTIPNSVTSIGEDAFSGCSGLTSVTIPNSVTSIGEGAFYKCSGLTSVTIPNSVTSIEEQAFRGCSGLTSVTIPNSVTSIGQYAFSDCSSLSSVTIPDGVTSIGQYAFSDCSGLTSMTIPNSVTRIGSSTFNNCTALTSVSIGNSVTSLGTSAFRNCSSLSSVTIPDGVTSIGEYTFSDCSSLSSVTIPESVQYIGSYAFDNTAWYDNQPDGLVYAGNIVYKYKGTMPQGTHITIKEGTLGISEEAFSGCTGLTSVTLNSNDIVSSTYTSGNNFKTIFGSQVIEYIIGDGVTSIGDYAFYGCSSMSSISIPENVTSIGSNAFQNCSGLTKAEFASIVSLCEMEFKNNSANPLNYAKHLYIDGQEITALVIPNNVTSIGNYAFYNCSSFTSVVIPNSVTSFGSYAFYGCSGLESVTIGNDVTSIGNYVFYNCSGLNSIILGKSVTDIGNYAFSGCTGLTSVTLPNSVTSIGNYSFRGCTGLTSVVIPNNVTSIGNSAFYNCSGLESVTIGSSVTSIGTSTFNNCSALKEVSCLAEQVPSTGSNVFQNTTIASATLYVPETSLDTYKSTTPWKNFGTILPVAEPTYIVGDANGNGEVEIGDVTSVLTLMATPEATGYDNKAADANGNGEIEIGDVTTILTIMAGN